MKSTGKWLLPTAVGFGLTALFLGLPLVTAQDQKAPDLTDLRDAVKAATRRGDNVDEVAKALDALDKALGKGVAALNGNPPPELTALRDAVEAAARKGENVERIRKELEAVEKAVTGRTFARPKPAAPPQPDPFTPRPNPKPLADPFLPEFPNFPLDLGAGGLNPNDLKMAQDLLRKAMDMRMKNPNGADGLQDLQAALEAFRKAAQLGEELGLPEFANPNPPLARAANRPRLGIQMERLTPVVIDQLGLERGTGVAVVAVVPDSPAEKAGLRVNDILVEFAGKPVGDEPSDLARRVNEVKAGEKVDLVLLRKGKKVEVKGVELADPAAPQKPEPRAPQFKLPALPDIKPLPAPVAPGVPD